MQVQRPRTRNTENVAYENRSDPCGCWCTWYSEEGYEKNTKEIFRPIELTIVRTQYACVT